MRPIGEDFAFSSRRLRAIKVYGRPMHRVEKTPVRLDAWQIREKLLAIQNEDDALRFLNETGPFYPLARIKGRRESKSELLLSDLRLCQEMIKENLTTRGGGTRKFPKEWGLHEAAENLHFTITHGPYGPIAMMNCENGLAAVWISILIDQAAGAEFRRCQRQDCQNVYKRESGHESKYCTYRCGHLVAVRKDRARKKNRRKHGKRA